MGIPMETKGKMSMRIHGMLGSIFFPSSNPHKWPDPQRKSECPESPEPWVPSEGPARARRWWAPAYLGEKLRGVSVGNYLQMVDVTTQKKNEQKFNWSLFWELLFLLLGDYSKKYLCWNMSSNWRVTIGTIPVWLYQTLSIKNWLTVGVDSNTWSLGGVKSFHATEIANLVGPLCQMITSHSREVNVPSDTIITYYLVGNILLLVGGFNLPLVGNILLIYGEY